MASQITEEEESAIALEFVDEKIRNLSHELNVYIKWKQDIEERRNQRAKISVLKKARESNETTFDLSPDLHKQMMAIIDDYYEWKEGKWRLELDDIFYNPTPSSSISQEGHWKAPQDRVRDVSWDRAFECRKTSKERFCIFEFSQRVTPDEMKIVDALVKLGLPVVIGLFDTYSRGIDYKFTSPTDFDRNDTYWYISVCLLK